MRTGISLASLWTSCIPGISTAFNKATHLVNTWPPTWHKTRPSSCFLIWKHRMNSKTCSLLGVKVPLHGSHKPLQLTKAGRNCGPTQCQEQATSGLPSIIFFFLENYVKESPVCPCVPSILEDSGVISLCSWTANAPGQSLRYLRSARHRNWGMACEARDRLPGALAKHKMSPFPVERQGLLTIGKQHLAHKITPRTLKYSSAHLKPSPAVTGTRESFLRGNLPSMDSFPFSKPKWLARDLPRKYERSKQAEKENLCWNLDKGHSFSQRNSPDHPQADICWEQMRSPGSPGSHHSPTSLKAKHNSTEQLF